MKTNKMDILDKDFLKVIEGLIATSKNPNLDFHSGLFPNSHDIIDVVKHYVAKKDLDNAEVMKICLDIAKASRSLTDMIYEAYYKLLEDNFKQKELELEQKLSASQKQFYTVQEVVAMSHIFNIKTENTLGKKLGKEIPANKVNNSWQIPRQSLIDYVGHDKF